MSKIFIISQLAIIKSVKILTAEVKFAELCSDNFFRYFNFKLKFKIISIYDNQIIFC